MTKKAYFYSIDSNSFYNDSEQSIADEIFKLKEKKKTIDKNEELSTKEKEDEILAIKKEIDAKEDELVSKINENKDIRSLRTEDLTARKVIALDDSMLVRSMNIEYDKITDNIFSVRIYHYKMLFDILENGFIHNDNKYVFFSSSAGNMRVKKIICIRESLLNEIDDELSAGLTVDEINRKGGINVNKYLAYRSLASTTSSEWKRFNIDKCIVVNDQVSTLTTEMDHIDTTTFDITRQMKDVQLESTDGVGMILPAPTRANLNFQFRMPHFKGLLVPFDFKKFANEHGQTKVVDIYGKEWDIVKDKINIIFTKSQFKMHAYYDSWNDYKTKFKANNCSAAKLNIEQKVMKTSTQLSYQMLQTLTTMTTEELTDIAKDTITDIHNISSDKDTMLRLIGATKENNNKNYLQKSLLLYNELLNDSHLKEIIKSKKKSLVRNAKAGKLSVNGCYTYIIPDLYAFCEWLFLGKDNPKGLLRNGEVSCSIFEEGELDVLRSPHLYKEHAIRRNTHNTETDEWFITKGIYMSSHDPMSLLIMCDFDGDQTLVTDNKTLIKVAKREMQDIVPLFYDMTKAKATQITTDNIHTALTLSFKSNVGDISNEISRLWNSDNSNIDIVKIMTMMTNFEVDYPKNCYRPTIPAKIDAEIKSFTKNKLPHFFKYAKDKEESQIEPITNSTVNKLHKIIVDKRISFKKVAGGAFDYRNLINRKVKYEMNENVIEAFKAINGSKFSFIKDNEDKTEDNFNLYIKNELLKLESDEKVIANMLVDYFFQTDSKYKNTLWNVYGKILYENLKSNIKNTKICKHCNKRVRISGKSIYCESCKVDIQRQHQRKSMQNKRKSVK